MILLIRLRWINSSTILRSAYTRLQTSCLEIDPRCIKRYILNLRQSNSECYKFELLFSKRDKRKLLRWYIQHRGRNTDVGREQNKQFLKLDIVLTDASRENDATGRLSMDDVPARMIIEIWIYGRATGTPRDWNLIVCPHDANVDLVLLLKFIYRFSISLVKDSGARNLVESLRNLIAARKIPTLYFEIFEVSSHQSLRNLDLEYSKTLYITSLLQYSREQCDIGSRPV